MEIYTEKQLAITRWINQNYDKWEIICGLKPMTDNDYEKITKILLTEGFYELYEVISTLYCNQKLLKIKNYSENVNSE